MDRKIVYQVYDKKTGEVQSHNKGLPNITMFDRNNIDYPKIEDARTHVVNAATLAGKRLGIKKYMVSYQFIEEVC